MEEDMGGVDGEVGCSSQDQSRVSDYSPETLYLHSHVTQAEAGCGFDSGPDVTLQWLCI